MNLRQTTFIVNNISISAFFARIVIRFEIAKNIHRISNLRNFQKLEGKSYSGGGEP